MRVELRELKQEGERLLEVAFLRPTIRELRELCRRHLVRPERFRFERGALCILGQSLERQPGA